jgi:hypothetical protein
MNMKLIALTAVLLIGGQAFARHVTHPVTPANIDKQPYAFAVKVKDASDMKEFEITVKPAKGKRTALAPRGILSLPPRRANHATPPLTQVTSSEGITYTFRLAPRDVDGTSFTFTESSEGPFPDPGDYWVFALRDFATAAATDRGPSKAPASPVRGSPTF